MIAPLAGPVSSDQYTRLALTATPYGPCSPVTRVVTPVRSRFASWIVPSPKFAQYRWAPGAPVPVSGSVAVAAD
jgi:hypothetical protein